MQVIGHQTNRIQLMWHLLLGFIQHSQQHIPSQTFSNPKLSTVAPQRDVKGIA
jgi:hypothetical protein